MHVACNSDGEWDPNPPKCSGMFPQLFCSLVPRLSARDELWISGGKPGNKATLFVNSYLCTR